MVSAAVTFSRISEERFRAERRIQKTIAVTKATAIRLSVPPKASWAGPESLAAVKVRTDPKLRASASAATTPVQTCGRRDFWPERTRVATRMETISPASRPSRRPIKKLGNASSHMALPVRLPDAPAHLGPERLSRTPWAGCRPGRRYLA